MNLMRRIQLSYLFLLCVCVLFCACSERKTVIGVSQCCGGLWREKANKEMQLAKYQYSNVNLLFTTAENDGKLQARQIDSMIAQKVDLIVVAPDNVNDVTPAIERAYYAKIPVILFDRRSTTSHYTASIGGDNVEAGREVARFMAEKLKGSGIVVEITGLQDASPVIDRHRGFNEVMRNYPQIKVVTLNGNWKMDCARNLLKQYLDKGGHADGVFAHSDLGAMGAYQEAKRRKIDKQLMIVGIDGLPGKNEGVDRVLKGEFAASYVYPTKGDEIMQLAMDILDGKPYKKNNYMQSFLATPDNSMAIALQYEELEAKLKDMDNISSSLDDYAHITHVQRWMIIVGIIVVLILLGIIYYIYKVYRRKLAQRKEVTRVFLDEKNDAMEELVQLDETERYFIDRFKKKIIENLGNADLKMDDLGSEMQLSKVQLYRKLKAMTGKTPVELLKEMRLQRAYTLLQQTDKSISEVAAEVGFAPGYFSSCFKKQYGVNPTELRSNQISD